MDHTFYAKIILQVCEVWALLESAVLKMCCGQDTGPFVLSIEFSQVSFFFFLIGVKEVTKIFILSWFNLID